ncbi:DUF4468 domain-containing protein [Alcanivorax jadensis]|uniref:DUF4468 domain-containing protein n=1 Tax=Alcanivorax jadensis TaxID=64988 RepID=UPI000C4E273A|nr:DUF4468 domain-containing protein [Alcanivorax jadensis]MBG32959.1 hypothetical protein [Alcanivorax sp.]MDF1637694.1 DUF4468 domain-containing protein [Alcanivorax jadensis]
MKIKAILSLTLITGLLVGCASMQPVADEDRTFDRVVEAPGHSKDDIYTATKVWIAENFKSAKSVIELDSKEDGIIIGNGVIPYPCSGMDCMAKSDWSVPFTMRVDIKDSKFKIGFSNIKLSWPPSYNSVTGASSGHEGPVSTQGDMDKIKPILLGFGDEILSSVNSHKSNSDW